MLINYQRRLWTRKEYKLNLGSHREDLIGKSSGYDQKTLAKAQVQDVRDQVGQESKKKSAFILVRHISLSSPTYKLAVYSNAFQE